MARIHCEPKVRADWMEWEIYWLSHTFSVPKYKIQKTWQETAAASTGLFAVRSHCNVMHCFIFIYLLLFSLWPSSIFPRTVLPFTSYLTFTLFFLNFLIAAFCKLKNPATFKPGASFGVGSKAVLKSVWKITLLLERSILSLTEHPRIANACFKVRRWLCSWLPMWRNSVCHVLFC